MHEAPLDEKTKEVRKRFNVDEETGYPKEYNWRPLAKLGPTYRPEKIYEVVKPYTREEMYSTNATLIGGMAFVCGSLHYLVQRYYGRKLWSKPWKTLAYFASSTTALYYLIDYKYRRQQLKNEVYADYMKKHPERFDTVYRPKVREVLFQYTPCR